MDKTPRPTWTNFENASKDDFLAVIDYENDYNAGLVDRLMDAIRSLDEAWTPYPLNRYQHCLQAATRAYNDGADAEIVVAALIHDVGDILAPYNHGELAAAILKPYVSEKCYWITKHHCVFQGYYYNHYLGGDRDAREKYRDSPHWEACRYFCHEYDQKSFDPEYPSQPLEFFEPILRQVLSKDEGHMELNETAADD